LSAPSDSSKLPSERATWCALGVAAAAAAGSHDTLAIFLI
jgi:hypothetical protein